MAVYRTQLISRLGVARGIHPAVVGPPVRVAHIHEQRQMATFVVVLRHVAIEGRVGRSHFGPPERPPLRQHRVAPERDQPPRLGRVGGLDPHSLGRSDGMDRGPVVRGRRNVDLRLNQDPGKPERIIPLLSWRHRPVPGGGRDQQVLAVPHRRGQGGRLNRIGRTPLHGAGRSSRNRAAAARRGVGDPSNPEVPRGTSAGNGRQLDLVADPAVLGLPPLEEVAHLDGIEEGGARDAVGVRLVDAQGGRRAVAQRLVGGDSACRVGGVFEEGVAAVRRHRAGGVVGVVAEGCWRLAGCRRGRGCRGWGGRRRRSRGGRGCRGW